MFWENEVGLCLGFFFLTSGFLLIGIPRIYSGILLSYIFFEL